MVIPIGDVNPRSRVPFVSWGAAAATLAAYGGCLTFGAPRGFAGFLLAPIIATDPIALVWTVLALLILADNIEDAVGHLFTAVFLFAAGWIGAVARVFVSGGTEALLGRAAFDAPYAGAPAAATAFAVAYALVYPLHEIRFLHMFGGRRRGLMGMFDSTRSSSEFHMAAPFGVLLWGLGVIVAAFIGRHTRGDLLALGAGGAAGAAFGTWVALTRFRRNAWAWLSELDPEPPPTSPAPASSGRRVEFPQKALPAPIDFAVSGWAVLRETDDLADVGKLGRIAAKSMGVPVADATRRIRQTRGVLARGMERAVAEKLAAEVSAAGLAAFAVDEVESGGLPTAQYVTGCGSAATGIEVDFPGGRKSSVRWSDVAVVVAARIDEADDELVMHDPGLEAFGVAAPSPSTVRRVTQTTVVDVVGNRPPVRFRIARRESAIGASGDISSSGFRGFAGDLLRHRGSTPVNKGLSVISSRGSWGYLAFSSPKAYEEYLWWLIQVIRRKSGATQQAAAAVRAPGAASNWLE